MVYRENDAREELGRTDRDSEWDRGIAAILRGEKPLPIGHILPEKKENGCMEDRLAKMEAPHTEAERTKYTLMVLRAPFGKENGNNAIRKRWAMLEEIGYEGIIPYESLKRLENSNGLAEYFMGVRSTGIGMARVNHPSVLEEVEKELGL